MSFGRTDLWAGAREVLHRAWEIVQGNERLNGTITISPSQVVLVGPNRAVTVRPPTRPVWDDRGWTVRFHHNGRVYEGLYGISVRKPSGQRVLYRFKGWILEPPAPGILRAYIADPPPDLRRHSKGACFQLTESPWFRVHWVQPAGTVDDAILYIERILAEALARPR